MHAEPPSALLDRVLLVRTSVPSTEHSSVQVAAGASPRWRSKSSSREFFRCTPTWMLEYPGKLLPAPQSRPGS